MIAVGMKLCIVSDHDILLKQVQYHDPLPLTYISHSTDLFKTKGGVNKIIEVCCFAPVIAASMKPFLVTDLGTLFKHAQ